MRRDTRTIQLRVTPHEGLQYELRAQELCLSVSEWLRTLARRDAGMWVGQEGRTMYYAIRESQEAQALSTQTEDNLAVASAATPEALGKALEKAEIDLCDVRVLVREGDTLRRATEDECCRMY